MILLTPGPCMTSEAVRAAAALPDLNHRDPDYSALHREVRERLSSLCDGWVPHVIGGSGTAAMEAAVGSCIERGPCLVVSNGFYAERYTRVFEALGIPCETIGFAWNEAWDLGRVSERLRAGGFEAVLATHHETSTGRLNPVAELASVAAETGATVIVDAVSSLGAEPLSFEGLHAVFSSANKCLHGLPGVSFVMVSPSFVGRVRSVQPRSYYLHLPLYEGERPPLTPPVPAVRAFLVALREFEAAGGVHARHERYARQAARIRSRLGALGLSCFTPVEEASCAVTVCSVPAGFTAEKWLAANYVAGYALFECKGTLRETHFQVSTMGEVTDAMVEEWLEFVAQRVKG